MTLFSVLGEKKKIHYEVEILKKLFLKNGYPSKFIDKCIFKFLNKKFKPISPVLTVPKKELNIVLPYLGKNSLILKTNIVKAFRKKLGFCKVKVIFKTASTLKSYFRFKNVVPEVLLSCQIYKFTC